MSWLKPFLNKAGPIALQVAQAAEPVALELVKTQVPFGGILTEAVQLGIQQAAAHKGLSGEAKKDLVLDHIDAAGPLIQEALTKSGLSVTDRERFAKGANTLVEAWLDLMKSTDAIPAPAAEAPGDFRELPAKVRVGEDGSLEIRVLVPADAPKATE